MKNKIGFPELQKEILDVPIGDKVKDKNTASNIRSQISSYSPKEAAIAAIDNNDINLFQFIFENLKIDPAATDRHNQNMLHIAAESGSVEIIEYIILNNPNIDPAAKNIFGNNILHIAVKSGNLKVIKYILDNITNIDPAATTFIDRANILHFAAQSGNVEVIKYILDNITNIDPAAATNPYGHNILHLATKSGNLEVIKYILKAGLIDEISPDLYSKLTQHSDSSLSNSIKAIQYLLNDEESKADFSKCKLDDELILKMFEHYVCRQQLIHHTILELKEIYTQKAKSAQLPETLIDGIPGILNKWAENILLQESYLMSEDYALDYEYGYLPSLIQYFNAKDDNNLVCLKQWFKNFPNLNKQLDDFIKSVKELQDYVESPDKKEEAEAELEQFVAKLKTNLIEQVYNDVAGAYLNELSKLPDDEMLTKCIVNEHFAAALKSINPLILNIKTQDKFSDIIEEYEVEKDKLKINFHDLIFQDSIEGLVLNDDTTGPDEKTTMGEYKPGSCFLNNID